MNKLIDIKTGQPVVNKRSIAAKKKYRNIANGKRWAKLMERIETGEIKLNPTVANQELDLHEVLIPYLDSLIEEDENNAKYKKRHERYLSDKDKE